MREPKELPELVELAFTHWKETKTSAGKKLNNVKLAWDSLNGCYYFVYAGMYHGVELDGYIHT